jgi:hypothetical protein
MPKKSTQPSAELQARIALQLCESLLHVLVEEHVFTKEKALEVIDTVVQLLETDEDNEDDRPAALALLRNVARSMAAKDR